MSGEPLRVEHYLTVTVRPGDFKFTVDGVVRRAWVNRGLFDYELERISPKQMEIAKAKNCLRGQPIYYTTILDELVFWPKAAIDTDITWIEMVEG